MLREFLFITLVLGILVNSRQVPKDYEKLEAIRDILLQHEQEMGHAPRINPSVRHNNPTVSNIWFWWNSRNKRVYFSIYDYSGFI